MMTPGAPNRRRDRPRALFLCPLMPAGSGNGLAMRAGVLLEGLARDHRVTVWVVPVATGRADLEPGELTRRFAERVVITRPEEDPRWRLAASLPDPEGRRKAMATLALPHLARFATSGSVARLRRESGPEPIERILVLRSYLAPFALPLIGGEGDGRRRPAILDLDDDEALTRRRLAELHRQARRPGAAEEALKETERFEALEREVVPRFASLLVCHRRHAEAVAGLHGISIPGRIAVVPNAVEIPDSVPRRPGGEDLRLLLVGNLGYLPNQDAARRLVRELAPMVRGSIARPVRVRIVGSGPPPEVARLAEEPDTEVWPDVSAVDPHYAWADIAVVPLRAGGGTRIKILEAFAHRVPVVATTLGAEGLEVEPDRHLLIADLDAGLADACARLAKSSTLRGRIVEGALSRVRSHYERSRVTDGLGEVLRRGFVRSSR